MNRKLIIGAVVLVFVCAVAFFIFTQDSPLPSQEAVDKASETLPEVGAGAELGTETPSTSTVKTFTVTGDNFAFDLKEINVSKGATVRILFQNSIGSHDWRLEGYEVGTKVLGAGQSETVEFVADQAGQFEYYCSVGRHREMGMKGNLIVQ